MPIRRSTAREEPAREGILARMRSISSRSVLIAGCQVATQAAKPCRQAIIGPGGAESSLPKRTPGKFRLTRLGAALRLGRFRSRFPGLNARLQGQAAVGIGGIRPTRELNLLPPSPVTGR